MDAKGENTTNDENEGQTPVSIPELQCPVLISLIPESNDLKNRLKEHYSNKVKFRSIPKRSG